MPAVRWSAGLRPSAVGRRAVPLGRARRRPKSAVGVILTGMGKDGAEGMLEMRQAGGRRFGQDEETSLIYGMPRVGVRARRGDAPMRAGADVRRDTRCVRRPDGSQRPTKRQCRRVGLNRYSEKQTGAMQTEQSAQLKLPAVLDLTAAEGFLTTLRQCLQGEGALRLDASGVETLTLPCVQILLAASGTTSRFRSRAVNGIRHCIQRPRTRLDERAERRRQADVREVRPRASPDTRLT